MTLPKLNERLEYIKPDGGRVLLHAPPSSTVLSEEGFGTPPLDYVVDRSPFQNGDTVRTFTLGPRPVQLVVQQNFCGRSRYWDGRATLLDQIRPNRITDFSNPGKLRYYLANGNTRQLDVWLEAGPGFAPPQGGWREWTFTEVLRWMAHNPVWYDPTQQSLTFVPGTAGTFPMTFPVTFTTFGAVADVQYDGTWLEQPSIYVHGPVTGLHIHNHTTGDMIGFDRALQDDESIMIVLAGNPTVTSNNGDNWLSYISPDSDLTTFALVPDPQAPGGVNDIHVSGSSTGAGTDVTLYWYNRYFGI